MTQPPEAAPKPCRRPSATGRVIRGILILLSALWAWNFWKVRQIAQIVETAERNGSVVAYHSSTDRGILGFNLLPTVGAPARVSFNGLQAEPGWYRRLRLLSEVNQLSLSGSNVQDDDLRYIEGMQRLDDLGLSQTAISDAGLAHLAGLVNIQTVDLSETPVTDEGLASLARFDQLGTLSLHGTKVTGRGLRHLKNCTGLTKLSLGGSPVDDEGLEAISMFPDLVD